MQDRHHHVPGRVGTTPIDRLLRDMKAVGSEPARRTANERLAAELGDDLLAAVYAELNSLDVGGFPLGSRARRVA